MADIFVSYATADRDRITPLVQALESAGWSVFWDVGLSAGEDWRAVLEKEGRTCRSMVVVWSEASVNSAFVTDEAEVGRQRRVLVPIRIDPVQPRLGFGGTQYRDLVGWDNTASAASFQLLVKDLTKLLGEPPAERKDRERLPTEQDEAGRVAEQERLRQAEPAPNAKEEKLRQREEASLKAKEEEHKRRLAEERRPTIRRRVLAMMAILSTALAGFLIARHRNGNAPNPTSTEVLEPAGNERRPETVPTPAPPVPATTPVSDTRQLPPWEAIRAQVAEEYPTHVRIEKVGTFVCVKAEDATTQVWDWPWEADSSTSGQTICRQDVEVIQQRGDGVRTLLTVAVLYKRTSGTWRFWKTASRLR